MSSMLVEAISDQKRLVRGEHWLATRKILRARDGVFHAAWRMLMVAGPAPREEIACIRELMPKAHITAVDIVEANLMAAIDAGANEIAHCDLADIERKNARSEYVKTPFLPLPLRGKKFDVVCLDLTGPANDQLRVLVRDYFAEAVVARGIMIVTFSYGRDVVEQLSEEWEQAKFNAEHKEWSTEANNIPSLEQIPEQIAMRIWYALRGRCHLLRSCLQYRGAHMPMVSCLLHKKGTRSDTIWPSFKRIGAEDYELAVSQENLGNVYACPAERMADLRGQRRKRRAAAQKAVETRQAKALPPPAMPSLKEVWEAASTDERREWWNEFLKPHLRAHLIEHGWTPPNTAPPLIDGGTARMIGNGRENRD